MTTTTSPAIACTRCKTLLAITDDRVAIAERLYPVAADPDSHRAYLAATSIALSGWEYDGGDSGLPYCDGCVAIVEQQRAVAIGCPTWCEDCRGYDLSTATLIHRKEFAGRDAYTFAVLDQVVDDEGGDPPLVSIVEQDGVSVADLLAIQAALPGLIAFLAEHGLTEAVTPA